MLNIYDKEYKEYEEFEEFEEFDNLCLICMDVEGEIILCSKCKYTYCSNCAIKINKLCSICFRHKKLDEQNYYDYYDYYSYYDELVFEPINLSYFNIILGFGINIIVGFCWFTLFILIVLFGYSCLILILKIILYLIYIYLIK